MKKITCIASLVLCALVSLAQNYEPADDKSAIKFTIKNFGINTGGSFKGLRGSIAFSEANPAAGRFEISVETATVNTDNDLRDSHLKKEDYLDVEKYPRMTFVSEQIGKKGSHFTVTGKLTIKDVTQDISFPFTAEQEADGLLLKGSFTINRRDFHVGGNSMVLADKVIIDLSIFGKKK